jgi:hypothetical protein
MGSAREEKIIKNARALRAKEHKLHQSLRLTTLSQADQFVEDRGLVSVLGGNELPSIVSAFLGREWKPSSRGFSSWLEWWSLKVSGESLGRTLSKLEQSKVLVPTRIFRRSKTLVSRQLWPSLTPVVKHFSEDASGDRTFSKLERNILEVIGRIGPIRTDKLRDELSVHGKTDSGKFHSSLSKLESYALIVGSEDPQPERHLHANIWSHWKSIAPGIKMRPDLSYEAAIRQLLEKALEAAVLAPEKEVAKWFRWKQETLEAKEKLLNAGKIIQAENFLVTPRAQ